MQARQAPEGYAELSNSALCQKLYQWEREIRPIIRAKYDQCIFIDIGPIIDSNYKVTGKFGVTCSKDCNKDCNIIKDLQTSLNTVISAEEMERIVIEVRN